MARKHTKTVCPFILNARSFIAAGLSFIFALLTTWSIAREEVKLTVRPHLITAKNHVSKIRNSLVKGQAPIFLKEKWEIGSDKDVMEREFLQFSPVYLVDSQGMRALCTKITEFTVKYAEIKSEKEFDDAMTQQRRANAINETHELEKRINRLLVNLSPGGPWLRGLFLFLAIAAMGVAVLVYRPSRSR